MSEKFSLTVAYNCKLPMMSVLIELLKSVSPRFMVIECFV